MADSAGWKTGVTMADVNGDSRVDIYVAAVDYLAMHGRNALYINNGDGTFTDRAKEYGLDFVGYSTQSLFFDYDRDGDLDMFLLNTSTHAERLTGTSEERGGRNLRAGDRLYRNDGNHFTDVSDVSGVGEKGVDGYGLGVVSSDFNEDGCPDLYVTNDFQGDDYLYMNNCNGTFSDSAATAMGHTSRFSMGVDAADFNNDGHTDIVSLDMLPDREDILKTSASTESFATYDLRLKAGYHPQFERNNLQLNRGNGRFSEIGFLAGIAATDWSWAPLFADFDNDGRKDLFITNGIYRRPNDLDYISYVGSPAVQASLAQGITERNIEVLKHMPQVALSNYAFRNNGNLTFTDMAEEWGLGEMGFSNGAAYVDLDNDGRLDLVVNNINAPASIYRNEGVSGAANGYLTVVLHGAGKNTAGVGARVVVNAAGTAQVLEQQPTRGFESSVDPRLHIGLGSATRIDSLTVIWPDQRFQVLTAVPVNRTLTLVQDSAAGKYPTRDHSPAGSLFADVTAQRGISAAHEENTFFDYSREPLMPHLLSTEGPALAVGDVNGDGLDDIYLGGAKWQPGQLLVQQKDGRFRTSAQPAFAADSLSEDVDATFFDANGDGSQDLFVVSGGNEFSGSDEALLDRIYINDGAGRFSRSRSALPSIYENGGCVAVGDFNADGKPDLFVGSRVVARNYGVSPKSHLLQNEGGGRFTDVTAEKAPDLSEAGMVSSAQWLDYDGDGNLDLIVVGEWMPVRAFHQENGRLVDRTREAGLAATSGWWSSVTVADLRGTGARDLILGNRGLNSYVTASPQQPARMYVGDLAHNGTLQQIVTFYKRGSSYPVAGRDELLSLNPALREKYTSYKSFGAAKPEDIFPAGDLRAAQIREASTFASAVALNDGKGVFTLRALPPEAQLAPIYGAVAQDFDGDGRTDLLVGGNLYGAPPVYGRYDASIGLMLKGGGTGAFTAIDPSRSGISIDGQIRDMKVVRGANGTRLIAVARNNAPLVILRVARDRTSASPSPASR